jgi:hypothetical protein
MNTRQAIENICWSLLLTATAAVMLLALTGIIDHVYSH